MKRVILLLLFSGVIQASSSLDSLKLMQKGEKIVDALCNRDLLPTSGNLEEIGEQLKGSSACPKLSKGKLKAVTYYLHAKQHKSTEELSLQQKAPIAVPTDAKCPVCGMFVYKYPKWTTHMVIDGKSYYFDGAKDMMKYYIFDGDFIYDRKKISKIEVNDYYTLEATPVEDAYFVYDSDVFGPMGRELIPFSSEKSAKTFMQDHHGKSIVQFDEITDKMVMALDD